METLAANWAAILGAVLLASFAAYLARRNGYKARKAAAAMKFRTAVLNVLSGLYPVPVAWPKNEMQIRTVLAERFPALQAAVSEFEPYVPSWRRKAYQEAWRRYRLGDDGRGIDQQVYWQYVPLKGTSSIDGVVTEHDQTKTYKSDFKANIDRLLNFASET
jgi:hypothetical protein